MYRRLAKNTGIYIFGSLASQGLVFVLWLVLGRWLAPEQIGLYGLVMFLVDLFGVLCAFGLERVLTRFYYEGKPVPHILSNALFVFVPATAVSLLLLALLQSRAALLVPGITDILRGNFRLVAALVAANAAASLAFIHYSSLKKAAVYAQLQLLRAALFFVLSVALAWRGLGLLSLLWGQLAASAAVAAAFLWGERRELSAREYSPSDLREMLAYGSPLVVYSVLGVVVTYFSRILLDRVSTLEALGLYTYFLTFTLQLNGAWSNLNRAWTPEVFSRYAQGGEDVLPRVLDLSYMASCGYMALLGFTALMGAGGLFGLVFAPFYANNLQLFYVLLLGPLFVGVYTILYPLFYYHKKTGLILLATAVLSALELALTLALVLLYRERGAALAYVAVQAVNVYVYLAVFRKAIEVPAGIHRLLLILLCVATAAVAQLLAVGSQILLAVILLCGAGWLYRAGGLGRKKQAFIELAQAVKTKLAGTANG